METTTYILTNKELPIEIREKLKDILAEISFVGFGVSNTQITIDIQELHKQFVIGENYKMSIDDISPTYFHTVIKKLPHSEGRVPYTYHHDYLRMNVKTFNGCSRSDVASNHIENEVELYAVALTELLDELKFGDTIDLNSDDIAACKKAMDITKNVVSRYNFEANS